MAKQPGYQTRSVQDGKSELRSRLLFVLGALIVFRIGSFIPVPGIDAAVLAQLIEQQKGTIIDMFNMFSGGAFSKASIFALGIMPYISASIVMQLLAVAVPYFQKMQRDGESGHKKINWYTRVLTIFILFFQAPAYLFNLKTQAAGALATGVNWTLFMVSASIILAAGSMFILWLGERITDKGVGNGVSIIIMVGIIARLPQAFFQEVSSRFTAITSGGLVMFIAEIIILYLVVCAAILLTQGTRKIPVQYAKKVVGNKQYGGARQYIPLKLFAANVMPIIFAQALMFIPLAFVQYDCPVLVLTSARSITGETWTEGFRAADSVLDVAQIWKRVPDLGAHTTLVKLEDAVHDVTLSRRDVRERAFGEIARFVRAYVLGRNGPETARRFDGVGAPRRDGAREAIDGAWKRETARNGDGVSALRRVDRAADGEIGGGRSG